MSGVQDQQGQTTQLGRQQGTEPEDFGRKGAFQSWEGAPGNVTQECRR